MSLQVWLPLTKDLRQQGLSNIAVTNNGVTSNTSGKLGGCYSFNGSSSYLTLPQGYIGTNWSYSLWVYTSTSTTQTLGCCRTAIGTGFVIFLSNTGKIRIDAGIGATSSQWTTGYSYPTNTWFHLVITANGNEVKYYINGEYKDSHTVSTAANQWGNIFSIGASQANGSSYGNYLNGKLNDIRIYDHCLSLMEVKELAKGLVLHYPLNRQGWGQENLLKNSSIEKTGASNSAQWFRWNVANPMLSSNHTYTLSFDAKMSNNTDVFYIGWANADSTQITMQEGVRVTDEYKRYSFTGQTTKTNINSFVISNYKGYGRGNGNNTTGVLSIKNIKLEEGSIATPWCLNSTDALATTMGLNGTTEYDCSGFCNNGTKNGTFDWTSNTAKYSVSQIFNGSNNAIQTPSLPTMITDKNYTIACWVYKTSIGTKGYQTIYGGPSGYELEARNGASGGAAFVGWNWGKPLAEYEFNKWNHFCFVHSDNDCKIYLNGEYISSGTAKASNPTGNYFIGAWNTATQQNYEGLMSDFRIYATALSASDVKSLYQNCATIDPDGTIRGQIRS